MSTQTHKEGQVSEEIKQLFQQHQEAIIITVDPVERSEETAVNAFVKMLDKNKGGKLASLLDSILTNLKATYGEKRGGMPGSSATHP